MAGVLVVAVDRVGVEFRPELPAASERASERFPVRFRCKMYSIVIQTQYTCCTFGASHLPCVAYTEGCVCHGRRLSDEIYRIRVHYQLVSDACLTGVSGNARSLARSLTPAKRPRRPPPASLAPHLRSERPLRTPQYHAASTLMWQWSDIVAGVHLRCVAAARALPSWAPLSGPHLSGHER